MKKSLNFLLMLLMVATVFTGCTKKADPAPAPAQLIVGKWKTVTFTTTTGSVTQAASACRMDNVSEFTASGSIIDTENTKCNPSDPATSTQTYSLSPDGKTLTLPSITYSVLELTSNSLKISVTFPPNNGDIVTRNLTFTKI